MGNEERLAYLIAKRNEDNEGWYGKVKKLPPEQKQSLVCLICTKSMHVYGYSPVKLENKEYNLIICSDCEENLRK